MRKLKIAQVIPYRLSLPGGVREHVLALTRQLRRLGHEVVIIAPGQKETLPLEGVVTFGRGISISTVNGSRGMITIYNEALWGPVEEFLETEKFDIIHVHSPEIPFLNWQILYSAKTTVVATFHSDFDWGLLAELVQWSLIKPIVLFLKTKIDGSIAVSKTARRFARGCFRTGDRVIPNGVDRKRFYPAKKSRGENDKINILFVGRIEERKGLPFLLEAFARLAGDKRLNLHVVGDGPQREEAEGMVKRYGLGERVRFYGRIADEKLAEIYRSADIFCSPAVGGESQGIVLLEAMATALPLVVFANPGYAELLRKYPERRCLVNPGDVAGLSEALRFLIDEPERRVGLGRWGGDKAVDYDWEKIAREVLSFYEFVMARKRVKKREYQDFSRKILLPLQRRVLRLLNGTVEKSRTFIHTSGLEWGQSGRP
jgi:phosphatidylinositol alpha-mannosyltransferase